MKVFTNGKVSDIEFDSSLLAPTKTSKSLEIKFKGLVLTDDLDYSSLKEKMVDLINHYNNGGTISPFQWEGINDNKFSYTEYRKLESSLNLAGIIL